LRTRFKGWFIKGGEYVDEVFRIIPAGAETKVVHEVDFGHSGAPWYVLVLMKLIDVIGYRVGKSSLEGIMELLQDAANYAEERSPAETEDRDSSD
jgi:hypothetical protein